MLKTIAGLQGVTILSKDAQKKVNGGTITCGFKTTDGTWHRAYDGDGNGATRDNALYVAGTSEMRVWNDDGSFAGNPTGNWCCASCSWN